MVMKRIRTRHGLLTGPMTAAAIALIVLIAVSGCADETTRAENYKASARQFASKGQYRESVLELKNALQINPGDYDAYYELAEIYIKMKDPSGLPLGSDRRSQFLTLSCPAL